MIEQIAEDKNINFRKSIKALLPHMHAHIYAILSFTIYDY